MDNFKEEYLNIITQGKTERQIDYHDLTFSRLGNFIHDKFGDMTKGTFNDSGWNGIHDLFDAMKEVFGDDFNWHVENGGYNPQFTQKTYYYTINYINRNSNKPVEYNGKVIGNAAGPSNDPWGAYDISFF